MGNPVLGKRIKTVLQLRYEICQTAGNQNYCTTKNQGKLQLHIDSVDTFVGTNLVF